MRELFSYLSKKGLSENKFERTLSTWDSARTLRFIEESVEARAKIKNKSGRDYSFVSNIQLSGGTLPCASVECRTAHLDRLARFAILYADQVLVYDPFEKYESLKEANQHVRKDLSDDLRLLYYIKPLLNDGVLRLGSRKFYYCEEHHNEVIVKPKLLEKLEKAKASLIKRFIRETEVIPERLNGEIPLLKIVGPEYLVEHGVTYRSLGHSLPMSALIEKENHPLTRAEIRKYGVWDNYVSSVVGDILIQNLYARNGFNYLTDREIDFDVIRAVNDVETNRKNKAVLEGLSHSVPFVNEIDMEKILKLRRNEGESFKVYRDSLNELLKSLSADDLKKSHVLKQAFNDSIRPELNKIDLTIKNSRKLLYGSIKRDVAFSAGFIGLGLFSGLLPPNIGTLIAGIGGYKFASSVAEKISGSITEPDTIRDNKFYFLWKIKNEVSNTFFRDLSRTVI